MNLPVRTPAPLLCAVAILLAIASPPSRAADFLWQEPDGGSFQDGSLWDQLSVPGVADTAIFDLADAGYTVTFAGGATTQALRIATDNVVFDLGGFVYEVTSNAKVASSLGEIATLMLKNGTLRQSTAGTERFVIGNGANGTVTLVLTSLLDTNRLDVGGNNNIGPSTGLLTVDNSSTVSVRDFALVGVWPGGHRHDQCA